MRVRDAMTTVVLTIGPDHTLRQAATFMSTRRVGAAVVMDTDKTGIGIITERDILNSIGAGGDPDIETASSHLTSELIYAGPEWTLSDAASAMIKGGFRHLIVVENGDVIGILSARDILRIWSREKSTTFARDH